MTVVRSMRAKVNMSERRNMMIDGIASERKRVDLNA